MYSDECALRDCQFKIEKIARVSDTLSWTSSGTLAGRELRAYFKCLPPTFTEYLKCEAGYVVVGVELGGWRHGHSS